MVSKKRIDNMINTITGCTQGGGTNPIARDLQVRALWHLRYLRNLVKNGATKSQLTQVKSNGYGILRSFTTDYEGINTFVHKSVTSAIRAEIKKLLK